MNVHGGQPMPLMQGQGIYVSTVRPVDRVAIEDAPLVFVGYGVARPNAAGTITKASI